MANNPRLNEVSKATQFNSVTGSAAAKKQKRGKSLATLVRELEDEDFDWTHVPIKNKEAVKAMGSPWKAIMMVAMGQAISGDKAAREWLRKSGYGDKLDMTTQGEKIVIPILGDMVLGDDVQEDNSDQQTS